MFVVDKLTGFFVFVVVIFVDCLGVISRVRTLREGEVKENFGLFVDFEFDGNMLFGHQLIDSH